MARKLSSFFARDISHPQNPCHSPKAGQSGLHENGFDRFEHAALHVIRHICLSMSPVEAFTADPSGAAQDMFDGIDGILIGTALTAFVQTMAMGRSAHFRFSNPRCHDCAAVLTDCERHLLSVLSAVRRGQMGAATAHAAMLCDRAPTAALLSAACDVAARGPCVARLT